MAHLLSSRLDNLTNSADALFYRLLNEWEIRRVVKVVFIPGSNCKFDLE
jgi:hypothetical protein